MDTKEIIFVVIYCSVTGAIVFTIIPENWHYIFGFFAGTLLMLIGYNMGK